MSIVARAALLVLFPVAAAAVGSALAAFRRALAVAVLTGLVFNAALGWWWADPAAGRLLVGYAIKVASHLLTEHPAAGHH